MLNLVQQNCEACPKGAPRISEEQFIQLAAQIPDWEPIVIDKIERLRRRFGFRNFADAIAFANRVGDLAEAADHHPAILVEWGMVEVTWWTHTINGLHQNDLILAARTDGVYAPAD